MQLSELNKIAERVAEYKKRLNTVHFEELKDGSWKISKNNGFIHYVPEPTAKTLHASEKEVNAVMGCIGSGKSTMCCIDPVIHTVKNMPKCVDGIKRSKGAIVRATFRQLIDTTWLTWLHWFGGLGIVQTTQAPQPNFNAKFNYKLASGETGKAEIQVLFRAFENPIKTRDDAGSLELTWLYINEARDLKSELVLNALSQRVDRYPYRNSLTDENKPRILLDTNAPDTLHWFYDRFEVQKYSNQIILKQPPGLLKKDGEYIANKNAENLTNLSANYYIKKLAGLSDNEIKVQLCGEYGSYQQGNVVYPNFSDKIHCFNGLSVNKHLDVTIGFDFGTNTAAVVTQYNKIGQLTVIDELFSQRTYLEQFIDNHLLKYIQDNLSNNKIHFVIDPSGKASTSSVGTSCETLLRQKIAKHKINGYVTLAKSNRPHDRVNAVDHFLQRMVAGEPAFKINNRCVYLKKGFLEEYILDDYGKPSKKCMTNHVHDCLQYAALEHAHTFLFDYDNDDVKKPKVISK